MKRHVITLWGPTRDETIQFLLNVDLNLDGFMESMRGFGQAMDSVSLSMEDFGHALQGVKTPERDIGSLIAAKTPKPRR